ncbi:hypothetical protein ACP70R_037752 [Stipagrostis hirtigluma subsp. patula]
MIKVAAGWTLISVGRKPVPSRSGKDWAVRWRLQAELRQLAAGLDAPHTPRPESPSLSCSKLLLLICIASLSKNAESAILEAIRCKK